MKRDFKTYGILLNKQSFALWVFQKEKRREKARIPIQWTNYWKLSKSWERYEHLSPWSSKNHLLDLTKKGIQRDYGLKYKTKREAREKHEITYNLIPIRLTADFLT
jgi:hypothetical protein